MASYTATQLKGKGTPCEALTGGNTYTFTLSNSHTGSAYFTFESVRDGNGFYSSSYANAKGTVNNLNGVSSLVSSPYIFSVVIGYGGGEFDFTPTSNIDASGSFLRTTGDTALTIS